MSTATVPAPFRVRTPDQLDNMGKPRRGYAYTYLIPGTNAGTFGNAEDNAVLVEVDHHAGEYRLSAEVIGVNGRSETHVYDFARDGRRYQKVLATGRYSARKLADLHAVALAGGVEALIPAEGLLRRTWDAIVAGSEG